MNVPVGRCTPWLASGLVEEVVVVVESMVVEADGTDEAL